MNIVGKDEADVELSEELMWKTMTNVMADHLGEEANTSKTVNIYLVTCQQCSTRLELYLTFKLSFL